MSNELARASQTASNILLAQTPEDHKNIDDQLSVVQDIMRRLGVDAATQDKVGAIRVWNMRKLRRLLGPKNSKTYTDGISSNSKLAQLANELGPWPFDEWFAWRVAQKHKPETITTATAAYKAAKYWRIVSARTEAEADPSWERPEALLFNAPFQEVLPKLDMVDMIFTDPPYARKELYLYKDLHKHGAPLLNEGGSLITYFGHFATPEVVTSFPSLKFWWLIATYQPNQRAHLLGSNVFVHWKPLAWFVKEGRGTSNSVDDYVVSGKAPAKEVHDWEQAEDIPAYYIEHLTQPGDWILDPMMGSGTTGIAALKMGRRFIGIEKDQAHFATAQKRLKEWLDEG
jgi:16S rRNA G966 N2-methylase RsmD